jgi:hypothetical protein
MHLTLVQSPSPRPAYTAPRPPYTSPQVLAGQVEEASGLLDNYNARLQVSIHVNT